MYQAINFKNNLYMLTLFNIIIMTGCSSTTPITVTQTEYIPPITDAGRDCINTIDNELRSCKEGNRLATTVCQDNANALAQENLSQAQINYTEQVSAQQQQKSEQDAQREAHIARENKQYQDCLQNSKREDAIAQQAYANWVNQGGKGSPPSIKRYSYCSTPAPYQGNQNNYLAPIKEPNLNDFIEDVHCFANSNECIEIYNRNYEQGCKAKVIKTTRCFANCEDEN